VPLGAAKGRLRVNQKSRRRKEENGGGKKERRTSGRSVSNIITKRPKVGYIKFKIF
jgi:hypothetical protein